MRHLSTSKYVQKASRNAAPDHRSVLEQVASWNLHSTAISTITVKKLLEVYSCEGHTVPRIWYDPGIV